VNDIFKRGEYHHFSSILVQRVCKGVSAKVNGNWYPHLLNSLLQILCALWQLGLGVWLRIEDLPSMHKALNSIPRTAKNFIYIYMHIYVCVLYIYIHTHLYIQLLLRRMMESWWWGSRMTLVQWGVGLTLETPNSEEITCPAPYMFLCQ
jgi:hypothetical protein